MSRRYGGTTPGMIVAMAPKTTPHTFNLRMSAEQYAELHRAAKANNLPAQQYIELQVFGQVRPRFDPHAPRKSQDQPQLPIDDEERPLHKSA